MKWLSALGSLVACFSESSEKNHSVPVWRPSVKDQQQERGQPSTRRVTAGWWRSPGMHPWKSSCILPWIGRVR